MPRYTLFILLLLASYASVCAVLYTPALPEIASVLNLSDRAVQKSLSIFMIGYACGHLLWGPLANTWGRKGATFFGLSLSILGGFIELLILAYPEAWILNLGRLITAIGASVGLKIAFSYISELYPKEETAAKISTLTLSFAIAPGIAIAIGGFLTKHTSWYSCFIATQGYGFILLLLSKYLPETLLKKQKAPLNLKIIAQSYLATLKTKALFKSSFLMGCGSSFIYLFASLAPFVAMKEIGLSPEEYGLYNFIPPIGMILGFYLTQSLKNKMKSIDQIKLGLTLASIFTAFIMFAFSKDVINPNTLFFPIPGLYAGLSLIFSNASSLSMASAQNKSNGSAMTNFLNMGLCVFVLFSAQAIPFKASKVLSTAFGILCIAQFFLWNSLKKEKAAL